MQMQNNPWFIPSQTSSEAKVRLFCLPFAGGGASLYRSWAAAMPPGVEVKAVQLPGRESRFREQRLLSAIPLARQIAEAMTPLLDRPFALFGYSTGALLAFETVRELRRRGLPLPACLFAAARHAPQGGLTHPPLAQLPRETFLAQVRHYYQPSEAAWQDPDLLELLLPILRDDITIAESYQYTDEPPLSCPIEVYVGKDDRGTPIATAQAWEKQTLAQFRMTEFPGGHFFLNTELAALQGKVRARMEEIVAEVGR